MTKTTQASSTSKYAAPTLVVYGDMVKLTATGSVNKTENGGHPTGRN